MDTIIVNEDIKLVPYFENYDSTLKWYEDRLQKMYNYLNTN